MLYTIWLGNKYADPLCRATLVYLRRGHPTPFPADILAEAVDSLGVPVAPTKEDVLELEKKGFLFETLDAQGDASRLLLRKLSVRRSENPIDRVASFLGDELSP